MQLASGEMASSSTGTALFWLPGTLWGVDCFLLLLPLVGVTLRGPPGGVVAAAGLRAAEEEVEGVGLAGATTGIAALWGSFASEESSCGKRGEVSCTVEKSPLPLLFRKLQLDVIKKQNGDVS